MHVDTTPSQGWESYPSFLTMAPTLTPEDYGFNASVPAARQQHPPGQSQIRHDVTSNWRYGVPAIRP